MYASLCPGDRNTVPASADPVWSYPQTGSFYPVQPHHDRRRQFWLHLPYRETLLYRSVHPKQYEPVPIWDWRYLNLCNPEILLRPLPASSDSMFFCNYRSIPAEWMFPSDSPASHISAGKSCPILFYVPPIQRFPPDRDTGRSPYRFPYRLQRGQPYIHDPVKQKKQKSPPAPAKSRKSAPPVPSACFHRRQNKAWSGTGRWQEYIFS